MAAATANQPNLIWTELVLDPKRRVLGAYRFASLRAALVFSPDGRSLPMSQEGATYASRIPGASCG